MAKVELSIAQKIKCGFFLVFQIVNTLEVNRLANYCEKQNRILFLCCSLVTAPGEITTVDSADSNGNRS